MIPKNRDKRKQFNLNAFKPSTLVSVLILFAAIIIFYNMNDKANQRTLKYWSVCKFQWNPLGNVRTMDRIFKRLGYSFVNPTRADKWDILWSIEYVRRNESHFWPARKLLKHQRINHFPGIYYISNKRTLSGYTSSKYLFPTFTFPRDEEIFSKFSAANRNAKYIEKNFDNRGVRIVTVDEFNKTSKDKIYQLFLDKPFLIEGHAFDFGVYVVISSINPLRTYRYDHEVFLRFCPEKYHPFNPLETRKYVVNDDLLRIFEMPVLQNLYENYTAKMIFESIIKKRGYDVKKFWQRIDDAINEIIIKNEKNFIKTAKTEGYEKLHHFFELLRFDFLLDEKLNPFIMEINMSPALTPMNETYERMSVVFEQLVYDTVILIGGGNYDSFMYRFSNNSISSNLKNVATNLEDCSENNCKENCELPSCKICIHCLSSDVKFHMIESYREHTRRGNFKRVFPVGNHYQNDKLFESLSESNRILIKWFEAKCESDESWC